MTRPLRVELVVPVGGMGGAEVLALAVLDDQAERVAVSVLGLGDAPFLDAARDRGWPVAVVPTGRRALDIGRAALAVAARWRRADDIDVVWANGVKAAAVAVPAGALTGVPVVWHKHDFSFDRVLARPLAAASAAVVASGPLVAEATARRDVIVLPPPRPPEPTGPVARLLPGEELVAACVGRLLPYKGVDDVVRGLPAGWRLAVVGDDDPADPGERGRLEALAARGGVADRVHFLGRVPDAARVMAGVDVVVVPTKVNERGVGREGWSMVADEAMAAGVPVVATRGGAVTERLGDAGIAVDQGAPEQIEAALRRLADPALRRAMGEAGRAVVRAQPTAREYATTMVGVLAGAARRPGAGLRPDQPVSVVVPFHDEGAAVRPSFEAVAAQLGPHDELVVVDDASGDGTADELARLAAGVEAARVVRLAVNGGPAAARNAGVRVARHPVVACTDAGCRPADGWLDALRAAFGESPPPALVTGVYEVVVRTDAERAAALACYPAVDEVRRARPLARAYGMLFGRAFDPRLSNGRSMAFTREAWEKVGGFPEHLRTAEDVAFGVAVAEAGGRCDLAVDGLVTWEQRPDLVSTARMYARYGRGDAEAGHRLMIGRDLARLAACLVAPPVLLGGGRAARAAVVAGAAAYLSLPVARVVRGGHGPTVLAWVPVALAVKDVAKGVGCLKGLLVHWRS